ncbi:hypothetical protein R83H12_01605 [Fibrobacteria bacterium R8-3-H12]
MPIPLIVGAGAIAVGKIARDALVGEMVSRGLKELEELYKGKGALDKQQAKNRLKEIEMVKYEMEISKEYATATKAQKAEMLKLLNKEKDELIEKNKLSKDEINYEQAIGRIEALNEKAKYGNLNEEQKLQLAASKDMAHHIKTWDVEPVQSNEMAIEDQTIKASIAGYNSKKKTQEEASKTAIQIQIEMRRQEEERIKAEGKEFDDNMKKKEEAMKNLAEFDERMRISSLDGEAKKQAELLASYEKQKAEIEAMHEAQLLYAEDDMEIRKEQYGRLLDMEATYQADEAASMNTIAQLILFSISLAEAQTVTRFERGAYFAGSWGECARM